MIIDLAQYRSAKEAPVSVKNGPYGEEIMNSNWNPAVVYMFNEVAQDAISPELPQDADARDVEEFLGRVYALATQI